MVWDSDFGCRAGRGWNAIKRFRGGSNKKSAARAQASQVPQAPKGVLRAKEGGFDAAVFVDPKTGRFCFPKYKTDKQFLVQIRDATNYREEFFAGLEPDERRAFTFADFEEALSSASLELEVDDFATFYARLSKDDFDEFAYLRGKTDDVLELIACLDEESSFEAQGALLQQMLGDGLLAEMTDRQEHHDQKRSYFLGLTKEQLKPYAETANIPVSLKKAELVERLVEADVAIDPVTWYKPTEKARPLIESLLRRYIDELKKNLERFHPFYAQAALEANHDTSSEVLESLVQSELYSEFWKEKLALAER